MPVNRIQYMARSREGRPDRTSRALDHHRRPRKADAPLRLSGQRAAGHRIDVVGVVHQTQVRPFDRIGHLQVVRGQDVLVHEPLAEQLILRHRKPVMLRQRQDEGVGVKTLHLVMRHLVI